MDYKWTKSDTIHHCMPVLHIQLFLIYGPEAVSNMDDKGNLPIHHILKQKPLVDCNVIQQLVNIAPMMCMESGYQNKPNHLTKLPLYYHYVIILILPYESWLITIPADPKGQLPLHLACIHGKLSIIPFLLKLYPHAMRQCDNQNRLPIHYASNNLPDITTETLQQLVKKWQDSCLH